MINDKRLSYGRRPFALNGRARSTLCTLLLPCALVGCEADLNLAGVAKEAAQASHRTDFYQAMASTSQVTLLAGNSGVMLVSRDQGQSWSRQVIADGRSLIDLDACADGSFIALSFDNHLWHSSDLGLTWSEFVLPTEEQMLTAACAPNGSWWVAGGLTTLLGSHDQGANWTENSLGEDAMLTNLQFIDDEHAVATGEFGLLFASQDGGAHWQLAGTLPDEFYPHASYFRSPEEGWVGGLNGFIYHTTDAGQSWQRQSTPSSAPIFGFLASDNGLFAVGDHSSVLQLAGEQWQTLPTPDAPVYLRAITADTAQRLIVAGGRGLLLTLDTAPSAMPAVATTTD
ncbi:YCF48-related protein [Pseudomonas abietaniphila]|uniref:YCF48-related protein n=3 Tax=Pseudomonas TaxID=286 RepID=UPI000B127ED6|nr:YCF48-related protein [Pseudomonas abietaniphila]